MHLETWVTQGCLWRLCDHSGAFEDFEGAGVHLETCGVLGDLRSTGVHLKT